MTQQYKQFGYNPDSAKQADSSLRIEEAGKYVGVIKHMEFITAKSFLSCLYGSERVF